MKTYSTLFILLFVTTLTFAQKKEKIKGSKTVTTLHKEVGSFTALEVEDNLEVYLEKAEKNEIKIEADDNLHDIISLDLRDNTLRLYTTKTATNFKKLIVRVRYTNDFKMVTIKNEATVNAIQEVQLNDITFKTFDFSKLYSNVNAKNFVLQSNDKSKTELNLKSENATIELSKNATLKALITTNDLKCDLYQKTSANIEGNAANATIRLDNNAILIGNKLTIKNANLTAESYSSCSIFAETSISIEAANKAEIQLFGTPKIEVRKFADEAKLFKKLK
jgi:hypothetical protein